jgi:hypothetical protein
MPCGQAKVAALAFESNLLAYIELLLFILVSITYFNTMQKRGIFDGLRIWLLNKQFSRVGYISCTCLGVPYAPYNIYFIKPTNVPQPTNAKSAPYLE